MTEQEFVKMISAYAVSDMVASGVLASVTIAQAILESGYGTTDLAKNANNFFGMKCVLSNNTWTSVWDGVSKYTKYTKEQTTDGREYTVLADFRKYPSPAESVRDHSLYLTQAKNGSKLRYTGLVGEKDPKKAIQIIKNGGYATDVKYVDKILDIISRFNLTQYDTQTTDDTSGKEEIKVKIVQKLATNSPCYKSGVKITPKGAMLHSVGCPQPNPLVFCSNWNSSNADACVHLVVGVDPVDYQLLPFDRKAWHCGSVSKGSGNNYLISLEMTEPATIKYTSGANWIETGNGANTKAHVLATYKNAVEMFAYLCKTYGFNPTSTDVIMSHSEGHKKGIASNHGDVEHIWNKYGLTMNQFRADVKKAMDGVKVDTVPDHHVDTTPDDTSKQAINKLSGTVTIIYAGADGINIRTAPSITASVDCIVKKGEVFTVVGISADEKWYKLKSGLFVTAIPSYVSFKATAEQKKETAGTGYFRVRTSWRDASSQIGAFKDKNNAINLCKQNSGYKVYNDSGIEIYPCLVTYPTTPFMFRVTVPDLRIRKNAGTSYNYHKKDGNPVYTGKGLFTIVKTKEGAGAKLWGLLKSYADKENGWIALDADYGHVE